MDNVLLDRRCSGSFELPRRPVGFRPGHLGGATPAVARSTYSQQYKSMDKGGAWISHAPALPYARPPIYSSPSLPLLPSNQPPLLPLPPTATKYATFPYPPPQQPLPRTGRAAAAAVPSTRQKDRRRKPSRPPPSTETTKARKKKPLERATPLPPAPAVTEALDDLEQEVARNFVQDLLHVLAPPPSSLPLPRFSLVVKASSSPSPATNKKRVPPPPAPSCNAEAAAADSLRRLLRL
ncbi:formin-like protein 14 [Oryza brachyantha]|uniref:formin-like protein 14 n=1 Tax=Oryza brachyantha TaxID=4533 RepID=UPI001ADBD746|nr:formin-like protein 14 [Oryza brachyantha]